MAYREDPPPPALRGLVECRWTSQGQRAARVLPDGCMDLVEIDGTVLVAGPDTTAFVSGPRAGNASGVRFRPGALPRLLGVPAAELLNTRVPLRELRPVIGSGSLQSVTVKLLSGEPADETTPWSLPQLAEVTGRLARGVAVSALADEIGWSTRTFQRQCRSVYGYGPATLRRVLRFRQATTLLRAGVPVTDTAFRAGYADAPHLHREVRALAGVGVAELLQEASAANRSTLVPSGSVTVA
jgi:AraC-like DNA-binding protein